MMTRVFVLALLLPFAAAPASALTVRTLMVRDDGAQAPPSSARPALSGAASLAVHLQLRAEQAARLDGLYESYASARLQEESRAERWQSELAVAQAPASFDERRASRLARDISLSQQKVQAELLSARARSLKVLSSVQRAQLEDVATDERIKVRRDRYYQLLLMPAQEMEPLPLSRNRAPQEISERERSRGERSRRERVRKGAVSYGAYGGYGYGGPQYGVGATYGRGPVGVHAGIGRGGPSLGVSIGGILGRGW